MRIYFGIIVCISICLAYACSPNQEGRGVDNNTLLEQTEIDSVEILTQFIKQDSTDYKMFLNRAILHVEKGKIDPALRDLMYALELNQDDPEIYLLLSDIYFLLEKPHNSINTLKKVLEKDPENVTAFLKLTEIYLLKGEYRTAQQYVEAAINLDFENAEAYYLKAITQIELGDTSNAMNNLKISARLDTINYMAFMQIASIYEVRDDSNSIHSFGKALSARPNDEKALYLLGMSLQNNGKFSEALDTYQVLTAQYPNHIYGYYNSGYIYLVELQDFESAEQAFQQVILLNKAFVQAVYNLGRTYEAMGLFNKARVQYREALQLLPNYPLAIQGLNRLDEMN